jgi:hypothetical protein
MWDRDIQCKASTATICNKIFSGYQPLHVVEWQGNQSFKDHLCPRHQNDDAIPRE